MSELTYRVGRCLLGKILEDARMSQSELAMRLMTTRQQINSYVLNKRVMTLETAKNVSAELNCCIEDLYEFSETGNEE